MNTDDRLKALYRASAQDAGRVQDGDLEAVIGRSGWPDEDDTPLDRIAGSAAHADILRVVMALEDDARELSREVAALRRPQVVPMRRPAAAKSVFALAAGVGAAALLIAGLGRLPTAEQPLAPIDASDIILSASFDGPEMEGQGLEEADPIFSGDFDS